MTAHERTVLVVAARQPDFAELLAQAGFRVALRTRPLDENDEPVADVAVVFRGRLIGRRQAAGLASRGVPVIEVLNAEPPGASTAGWIRLSNRISKNDLLQVVRAVSDWSRLRRAQARDAVAPADEASAA